jgi:hypothetical protein
MGGPGSGRHGGARDSAGKFTVAGEITMVVTDAIENVQMLESEVADLQRALDKEAASMTKNKRAKDSNTDSTKKNTKEQERANIEKMKSMVVLQSLTSASNQLTGATYKMISGAQASGFVDAERAAEMQNTARQAELLTGAFEAMLAIEILLQGAGLSMGPILTSMGTAMTGYATATWGAVAAQYALIAPWMGIIAAVTAAVAVFVVLIFYWDELKTGIGQINEALKEFAGLMSAAGGLVTGLTSNVTGLGDVFTNNPMTNILLKGGGAIV